MTFCSFDSRALIKTEYICVLIENCAFLTFRISKAVLRVWDSSIGTCRYEKNAWDSNSRLSQSIGRAQTHCFDAYRDMLIN